MKPNEGVIACFTIETNTSVFYPSCQRDKHFYNGIDLIDEQSERILRKTFGDMAITATMIAGEFCYFIVVEIQDLSKG